VLQDVYVVRFFSKEKKKTGWPFTWGKYSGSPEGNAITASLRNLNHQALMLKAIFFNVLNFKDTPQII